MIKSSGRTAERFSKDVRSAGNLMLPALAVTLAIVGALAFSPPASASLRTTCTPSSHCVQAVTTRSVSHGYWLVGRDGGVFTFGSAQFYGSTGALRLQRPVVGITATSDHRGYWLVASDGGVFAYGDAGFYGSLPGLGFAPAHTDRLPRLNAPVVGIVPSEDGGGYFMVAGDGGVFAFGDARFEGSCPGIGGCSGTGKVVMPAQQWRLLVGDAERTCLRIRRCSLPWGTGTKGDRNVSGPHARRPRLLDPLQIRRPFPPW